MIVEMCDSSNYTDDSAVEIGSDKMILVETDVEAEGMYAAILPQSYEMGEAVAEAVITDYGEKLKDTRIGILAGNLKQTAGQQCLKGFMDKIESAGASILWNLSDEDNVNNTFEWCLEKKRVDIVVSLDNDRTEQAVDYSCAQNRQNLDCMELAAQKKMCIIWIRV